METHTPNNETAEINYLVRIQEKLSHIPVTYLAHLYELVALMAKPFEEEKPVRIDVLEKYVHQFLATLGQLTKDGLSFNTNYQFLEDDVLLLEFEPNHQLGSENSFQGKEIDIRALLDEDGKDYETFLQEVSIDKVFLFGEDNITLVKSTKSEKWTIDIAQADARDLLGLLIQQLPKEKANEYSTAN